MLKVGALLTESMAPHPAEAAHPAEAVNPADAAAEKAKPPGLSRDELGSRLALSSPKLVKELYDIAIRQIAEENARQTRLDAKATSLLTAAGLSLTVAFTFGGQLVLGHHKTGADHLDFPWWGVAAFCAALFAGLSAAAFAMRALLVGGGYRAIDEQEIFKRDLLSYAEGHYHPEAEKGVAESDEQAATEYRKTIIPHLWEVSQEHLTVHQRKADIIRSGQLWFLGFILAICVVCVSLVVMIFA